MSGWFCSAAAIASQNDIGPGSICSAFNKIDWRGGFEADELSRLTATSESLLDGRRFGVAAAAGTGEAVEESGCSVDAPDGRTLSCLSVGAAVACWLDCSAGRRRPHRSGGEAGELLELLELMIIGAVSGMSSSEVGPGLGSTSPHRRIDGD